MSYNENISPRPQIVQYVSIPDWDRTIDCIYNNDCNDDDDDDIDSDDDGDHKYLVMTLS